MFKIPPKFLRWGQILLVIAGAIWIWYNPNRLFEGNSQTSPNRQSTERPPGPLKPLLRKTGKVSNSETGFDFYVLALSWSPSFCATKKDRAGFQCGGKRFFSFVVHGLWPQHEKGWPSFCDRDNENVPGQLANSMLDIMPGQGLIRHQWKKHGTCSGLKQDEYFTKLRSAYKKIKFPAEYRLNNKYLTVSPAEVERAFQSENSGLADNAIAVTCGKRRLKEVRICFSKSLEFRACKEVDRQSCRKQKIIMPPVRASR